MDQVILVENQLKDGRKLIEQLVHEGFDVQAAGWIKTCEDYQWYLYLVSPAVLKGDVRKSYRRVHTMIRQTPQPFWVDPFDVKLLSPTDRLAKGMLDAQRRYGVRLPNLIREMQLGDVSIDGAYLYPPVSAAGAQEAPVAAR